jgi:uncharacterized protein with HXXEE motif
MSQKGLGAIIILAPLIFTGHFLEESPGFVAWFNAHVSRGITSGLFWNVNITALVITIIATVIELSAPSQASAGLIIFWLSFLMLANAIFHVTGAVVDKRYMPGLITAIVLYLPYYFLIVGKLLQRGRLKLISLIIIALLGSALMLIHGYLIIFRGSRLF